MKTLVRFFRLPSDDRLLLAEAAFVLAAARLAILLLPFSVIARWLGQHRAETPIEQAPAHADISRRVSRAVARAARHLPWESVCLPRAIAAKRMLRRRGVASTLYLGVQPGQTMSAHAWVRAGGIVVTGENGREGHTVVSTFA